MRWHETVSHEPLTPKSSANLPLSALGGGEGRGEVGEAAAREFGATHLTLPVADATGPLPLPPQAGGEGKHSSNADRSL